MTATRNVAHLITATGVTVFLDGQVLEAPHDHPNFQRIVDLIGVGDFDAIPALINLRKAVVDFVGSGGKDNFTMIGDFLALNGKPFTFAVTEKVLSMIEAGNAAEPIYRFLTKVRDNPRVAAQDELLLFCVANGFMIHEDGDIIAYKSVRGDYTDIHSGKFRNAVGDVVSMDRQAVDDDRAQTCSTGLHFASYGYASTWAGSINGKDRRLMVMKINPADVVAIPNDYNNQKGRCWKYEVISEITSTNAPLPNKSVYTTADLGGKVVNPITKASNAAERARKEAIRDRWESELQDLRDERETLESEIADLEERIEQVEDLGGDASSLQADLDDAQAMDCTYQAEYDLERRIAKIEREIASLR